jgi:hypothetical protein
MSWSGNIARAIGVSLLSAASLMIGRQGVESSEDVRVKICIIHRTGFWVASNLPLFVSTAIFIPV